MNDDMRAAREKGRGPVALFLVDVIKWFDNPTEDPTHLSCAVRLLRQLGVPVRVTDELGPALVPGRVLRIDRIPLGLLWRGK